LAYCTKCDAGGTPFAHANRKCPGSYLHEYCIGAPKSRISSWLRTAEKLLIAALEPPD